MNKKNIITALFSLVAITGFHRVATAQVIATGHVVGQVQEKKEKKLFLYGTVADGFTRAAIEDAKVRPIAHFAGWNTAEMPIPTGILEDLNV